MALAPSGVLTVGAALVLRDVVQRCLGLTWGLAAIAVGTMLSAMVAPTALVLASGIAFALSEFADFAVYTPLQQRRLTLAVVASSVVGLVVDSVVFLTLAFGSLQFLPGQVVGKLWAVLIAIPLMRLLRRAKAGTRARLRDTRSELAAVLDETYEWLSAETPAPADARMPN